ncbi:MAG: WYL domain-containing protein [Bacteroidetes bacterium]|nr:WYL domain-containing protein [Bacteroidota bacterium]
MEDLEYEQSQRSLERDFKRLRENLQIKIEYDRACDGYYIAEDSISDLDHVFKITDYLHSGELLQTILSEGLKKINIIDMDSNGELLGADWLDLLLKSITNKQSIVITYQSFNHEDPFSHDVSPWLLKFYQGRWYVVGNTHNGLRIFGVDRILDIHSSNSKYVKYKANPREIFKNQVGIYYTTEQPVEVRFLATPVHAKYLNTLKMHHSQKYIGKQKEWELYSLFVTINFELTQQFLLAGQRVKVLSPPDLVNRLKGEIKNMYKLYFDSDR